MRVDNDNTTPPVGRLTADGSVHCTGEYRRPTGRGGGGRKRDVGKGRARGKGCKARQRAVEGREERGRGDEQRGRGDRGM